MRLSRPPRFAGLAVAVAAAVAGVALVLHGPAGLDGDVTAGPGVRPGDALGTGPRSESPAGRPEPTPTPAGPSPGATARETPASPTTAPGTAPSKGQPPAQPGVSDAQARALLAAKVRQAGTRDRAAYCADTLVPHDCQEEWVEAGGELAVPNAPPRVVQSKAYGDYRALRVCGTRGNGKAYEADFVLWNSGGALRVVMAVWWGDYRFSGVYVDGAEPTRSSQTAARLC